MGKLYQNIAKKPGLIVLVILGLTALFVLDIARNAEIVTDLDEYMPSEHPAFMFSDQAEEQFDISDNILLAIEHPDSIYNQDTLEKIKSISLELPERFDEIEAEDITSLYTAENITSDEWGLTVQAFYRETPGDPEELEALQEAVEANEMIHGRIVSTNGTATMIIAEVGDDAFTDRFYSGLKDFASEWEGPETIYIAGRPVVEGELTRLGPKDMARMGPLVIVIITFILLVLLRSVRSTLINLIIVLFGTISAFGLMSLLQVPVYTVSTMIPVMLIAIGVAYGIHMHNSIMHLSRQQPEISRDELVKGTLKAMVRPVSMAAVTTAVGFLSLMSSQVLPVRYFGLFTAFGVLIEMAAALILYPAAVYLFGPFGSRKAATESPDTAPVYLPGKNQPTLSGRFSARLLKNPALAIYTAAVIALLAGAGAGTVWIDTSFLANFQNDSEVVQTDTFVNRHFGGTSTLNVILSSSEPDTFKQPEVLNIMDSMQAEIEAEALVGDSFAITDYMKRMNQVMHADDRAYNTIPDSQEMVAQYLLLYEMSGDPDNLNRVVDYDYMNANLTFQLKSDSSAVMEDIISAIDPYIPRFHEHGVEVNYAGSGYKSLIFATLLLEGQIYSLLISFGIVALLLTLMFRSIWIGLAGTIPIAITALVNFGTMGLLGIPLSSSTAIISGIAIGIGVDYAIHLIERYRSMRRSGLSPAEAASETLGHTGRAIIYNAAAVMGGFAVLLISVFPPNRQVGGLIALNMATSAVGTLTVLLVVAVFIDRRTTSFQTKYSKEEYHE